MLHNENKAYAKFSLSNCEHLSKFTLSLRNFLAICWIAGFAGCASDTGTKAPMNGRALAQIDQLYIQVSVEKDFSVTLAREEVNWNDFFFGGLIGGPVLQADRQYEDAAQAKSFHDAVAKLDLQNFTQSTLIKLLQNSGRFKLVIAEAGQVNSNLLHRGILRVVIQNWGLRADSKENAHDQKVHVAFNLTSSLVDNEGKMIWEHKDYYTSGMHRLVLDYISSPELLKNAIDETIARYCGRVANEIRYAD